MSDESDFARLVSLACHDLRTPLATVYGFARTLAGDELPAPAGRYVEMIALASQQMAELLDDLGLAARIEGGRYEPALQERDTAELARAAAERAGDTVTAAGGVGASVELDPEPVERALAGFALAAQRHGGVDSVEIAVAGREFRIGPVVAAAAPVLLGSDVRDLGSAVGVRLLHALGGDVTLEDGHLLVRV